LGGQVTSLSGTVTGNQNTITNSLNQEITNRTNAVNGITSTVSGVNTRLITAEGTLTNINSRVSTLESATGTSAEAVALRTQVLESQIRALGSVRTHPQGIWTFSQTIESWTATGGALTWQSGGGIRLQSSANSASLTSPTLAADQTVLGRDFPLVLIEVENTGSVAVAVHTLEYQTTLHGLSLSHHALPIGGAPTVAPGSRIIIVYDMRVLTQGGTDWTTSSINALRYTPGQSQTGQVKIWRVAILGPDGGAAERNLTSRITNEETARVNALTTVSSRTTALESTVNTPTTGLSALVTSQQTAISDLTTNKAATSRVDALESTVNTPTTGLSARVTSHAATLVSLQTNKAESSLVNTINATVGGHNSSITSLQTASSSITGRVEGTAGLTVQAGNRIAGMRIHALDGTDTNISSVEFIADSFKIWNGTSAESPFSVIGGVTSIQNAMIQNLSVGRLGDGTVSAVINIGTGKIIFDNGSVMKVQGVGFGSSNQFIEWFGPKMAFNLCNENNGQFWMKTNGDTYFGGQLSIGTLTTRAATSSLSAAAEVETSDFGSNGGQILVTLSYTFSSQHGEVLFTQPFPPNVNDSGSNNTVIQLYRRVGGAAETQVATMNASGVWTHTGTNDGDSYPIVRQSNCAGSLTYNDPQLTTQTRKYRAVISSRSNFVWNNVGTVTTQNISLICSEQ
jgi:hypothetical protein